MVNFKSTQTQEAEKSVFLNRILFSSLAILLLGGLIVTRLVYLMVIETDELSLRSINNTLRTQSIPAPRGLIYDRNNQIIAENLPKFQLEMIPEQVIELENSLLNLKELLRLKKLNLSDHSLPCAPEKLLRLLLKSIISLPDRGLKRMQSSQILSISHRWA